MATARINAGSVAAFYSRKCQTRDYRIGKLYGIFRELSKAGNFGRIIRKSDGGQSERSQKGSPDKRKGETEIEISYGQ